jgi:hypothetical protein
MSISNSADAISGHVYRILLVSSFDIYENKPKYLVDEAQFYTKFNKW